MMKFLPVLLLVCIFSCSKKNDIPADIIPPKKMQNIFWDYLKADAYSGLLKKDSANKDTLLNMQMQNSIFKHYQITKEAFYKSYQYYIDRPELMRAICDSIIAMQKRNSTPYNIDIKKIDRSYE